MMALVIVLINIIIALTILIYQPLFHTVNKIFQKLLCHVC